MTEEQILKLELYRLAFKDFISLLKEVSDEIATLEEEKWKKLRNKIAVSINNRTIE